MWRDFKGRIFPLSVHQKVFNYFLVLLFFRTLQEKIYKYMAEKQTRSFIMYLSNFVHAYNNTVHSSIKRFNYVFCFD